MSRLCDTYEAAARAGHHSDYLTEYQTNYLGALQHVVMSLGLAGLIIGWFARRYWIRSKIELPPGTAFRSLESSCAWTPMRFGITSVAVALVVAGGMEVYVTLVAIGAVRALH